MTHIDDSDTDIEMTTEWAITVLQGLIDDQQEISYYGTLIGPIAAAAFRLAVCGLENGINGEDLIAEFKKAILQGKDMDDIPHTPSELDAYNSGIEFCIEHISTKLAIIREMRGK